MGRSLAPLQALGTSTPCQHAIAFESASRLSSATTSLVSLGIMGGLASLFGVIEPVMFQPMFR